MKKILTIAGIALVGALILYRIWLASVHWKEESKISRSYDSLEMTRSFNTIRRANKIHVVEQDWIIERYDSTKIVWATREKPYPFHPIHIKKYIYFKNFLPDREEDHFHFNKNDSLSYRLVIESKYEDRSRMVRTGQTLLTYFKGVNVDPLSINLTESKADSILFLWHISNNS
jgi:hypothetical protein